MTEKKINKQSWRRVWGVLGLAALFACGVAVGLFYNTGLVNRKITCIPDSQCTDLANKIAATGFDLKKQEELIILYNQNCFYNKPLKRVEEKKPLPVLKIMPAKQPVATPERTCEVIETLLQRQLKYYSAANSPEPDEHYGRAQIYSKLSDLGCEENYTKYKKLAGKEIAIAQALVRNKIHGQPAPKETAKAKQPAGDTFKQVKELTDPAIQLILALESMMCD